MLPLQYCSIALTTLLQLRQCYPSAALQHECCSIAASHNLHRMATPLVQDSYAIVTAFLALQHHGKTAKWYCWNTLIATAATDSHCHCYNTFNATAANIGAALVLQLQHCSSTASAAAVAVLDLQHCCCILCLYASAIRCTFSMTQRRHRYLAASSGDNWLDSQFNQNRWHAARREYEIAE